MIILIIFADGDINKIRARDPEIFELIFREYNIKIFNFILIKTRGDRELAEEILSSTFHSALESAPKLRNTKNIISWLISIANNKLVDFFRNKNKEKSFLDNLSENEIQTDYETEDDFVNRKKLLILKIAMEQISEKYRKILKLKYYEKKSQKEIAKILGKSRSASESIIFRAREALKKEIKKLLKKEFK